MNDNWLPSNFKNFNLGFTDDNIFLCNIPKNASTSIRKSLNLNKRKPYNNEKIKIVTLRNPYERALSSYSEILKLRTDGPYQETKESDFFKLSKTNFDESFVMFLKYIDNRIYDSHVHRQIDYINRKGFTINDFNYVLDFSNIKNDFIVFKNELNIQNELLDTNKSTINNKNYLLDDVSIRKLIENVYHEDIELYFKQFK